MAVTGKGAAPFRSAWLRSPHQLRRGIFWADTDDAPSVFWGDFALAAGGAIIAYWDGDSWEPGLLKRWSGAAWETPPLKRWTGATWETV